MLLVSEINRRTKTTLKSYLVKVFFIWQSNDFADEWQLILFQSEKLILPSLTMISNQCFLFLIQRCMWNEVYIQRETPFSVIYVQLRFLDIQCNLGTANYTGRHIHYHRNNTPSFTIWKSQPYPLINFHKVSEIYNNTHEHLAVNNVRRIIFIPYQAIYKIYIKC